MTEYENEEVQFFNFQNNYLNKVANILFGFKSLTVIIFFFSILVAGSTIALIFFSCYDVVKLFLIISNSTYILWYLVFLKCLRVIFHGILIMILLVGVIATLNRKANQILLVMICLVIYFTVDTVAIAYTFYDIIAGLNSTEWVFFGGFFGSSVVHVIFVFILFIAYFLLFKKLTINSRFQPQQEELL